MLLWKCFRFLRRQALQKWSLISVLILSELSSLNVTSPKGNGICKCHPYNEKSVLLFLPSMPSPLLFLLFQQAAALSKCLLTPWTPNGSQAWVWGLTDGQMCMPLWCNVLFSVSEPANALAERIECICIRFKQAFRTSWAFQGKGWSSVLFKRKGFTDTDISEGLGLFNCLLRVSECAEMRYYAAVGHECFR